MKTKRHSPEEVAAKLRQAEEMTAQGKRQGDIARSLGVSMMTYHRWRTAAAPPRSAAGFGRTVAAGPADEEMSEDQRIRELQHENDQLRRLLTDLLLEKVKLEEMLKARSR